MRKKIIFIMVLLLTICFFQQTYALTNFYYKNDNGVEMTEEEYNNFLKLGYTKSEIAAFSQELYDSIKDDRYDSSASASEYYEDTYIYKDKYSYYKGEDPIQVISKKITKEEYDNSEKKAGYVKNSPELKKSLKSSVGLNSVTTSDTAFYESNAKIISIVIWKMSDSNIKRKVNVLLSWKTMPKVRSYDVLAVRVDKSNGSIQGNTQSGAYQYTYESALDCNMSSQSLSKTFSAGSPGWNTKSIAALSYYGVGLTHKLAEDDIACFNDIGTAVRRKVVNMSTHFTFDAITSDSKLTVYASYQHAASSVNYDDVASKYDFKAGGLGNVISFNSSTTASKFDGMGGVSLSY